MAAGVHCAVMSARVWQASSFRDRQRVNVSAKRDARFTCVADPCNRCRRCILDAVDVLDAQPIQLGTNRGGGFKFLIAQLWDLMQTMPQIDDARSPFEDEWLDVHKSKKLIQNLLHRHLNAH